MFFKNILFPFLRIKIKNIFFVFFIRKTKSPYKKQLRACRYRWLKGGRHFHICTCTDVVIPYSFLAHLHK